MKLLAVTRLSVLKDESGSPELQLKTIRREAEKEGHVIVGVAEDTESVSGDVPPWERPALGPWLRGEREDFDGIIVDRPNRLGRNTLHFLMLAEQFYNPGRGKPKRVLISVKPKFDFSTADGRKRARDAMSDAEYQREETGEQVKRSIVERRDQGRYWGGPIPYGTRKVKLAKGEGWGYAVDDTAAEHIEDMAEQFLAGQSLRGIARAMNTRGIPSPRGAEWCPETVRIVLRSPAITGLMVGKGGEPYQHSETGDMVSICNPIIPFDQWQAICDMMEANGHKGPRSEPSNLYGIVYCGHDGFPFYSMTQTTRGKVYRYIRCSRKIRPVNGHGCNMPVVQADDIERILSDVIKSELGDVRRRERIIHKAKDYAAEIAQADHSIAALEQQMLAGNLSAERFASMVTRFEQRKAEFESAKEPERVEWRILPETFGQHWHSLDWQGRQAFLTRNGVKVTIVRDTEVTSITGETMESPETSTILDMPGSMSVKLGKLRVYVWLGDLEALRKSAGVV